MSEPARIEKVIGSPTIQFWSSVSSFDTPQGDFVVVVLTINPKTESFDLKSQGQEILGYLENRYKEDPSPATPQKLKRLAETTSTRFEDAGVKLQICAIAGEAINLCTQGGGEISLLRGGNEYKLISRESAGKSLAGPVKEGDLFTLTSGEEEYDSKATISPTLPKPEVPLPKPLTTPTTQTSPKNHFKNFLSHFPFHFPASHLPPPTSNSKKTTISVGIILLILLGVSIGFGLVQKNKKEYRQKYETRLLEAQKSFDDSLVQAGLNPRVAKELFLKSRGLVQTLKDEGIKDERILKLEQTLNENSAKLLGVVEAAPGIFLDLTLVRSGLDPQELVISQEKMAILDKAGSRVVTVSTEGTGQAVLGGTEKVGSLISVATYAGRVFTLSEKGILEVSSSGNTSVAVEPDPEWGSPVKVRAFGSNLYLMTAEGEIWRFPASTKGFAAKQRWLGPGVTLSYGPRDLALDGSIWVLSESSKIQKYTRGAPNSFSAKDITFSDATALYTDETLDSLFVLDAKNSRIAQLSKTGDLEKEYKSEDFKEGRDLVVSSKVGKIFLLTTTRILEIPVSK